MKTLIAPALAASALLAPAAVQAQEAGPEEAVVAFMTAFSDQDTDAMADYIVDETVVAFVQELPGTDRSGFSPMSALMENMATIPADLEEPIWDTRFDFLVNGNRSHCGTNIFTLMRIDEAWKIATVTYSHETEGCEGPPAE